MNPAAQLVRVSIARADVRRRSREADQRLWRIAPWLGAVDLGVAAVSRWEAWSVLIPLAVVAASVIGAAGYLYFIRRARPISDVTAAKLDRDAGLVGELRSANWFASLEARDDWADLHLERAADRLQSLDWAHLYPFVRRPRAWTVTALLMSASLVLVALTVPGRVALHASGGAATSVPGVQGAVPADALPAELAKQLQDLLAQLDAERLSVAEMNTKAAELRDLLDRLGLFSDPEKLKDLEQALREPAEDAPDQIKKMLEMAKNADRAANVAALPPDVRDALKNLSLQLMEDAQEGGEQTATAQQKSSSDVGKDAAGNNASGSDLNQASIQFSRDQGANAGAGMMMLAPQSPEQGTGMQSGPGGGTDQMRTGRGSLLALEQALRRETVEASKDIAGDNVTADVRRKTEHSQAGSAFTHAAAVKSDKGGAAAPPEVPEARRSQVQSYFIRKQ
jgi:hypothetical protein